VDASDCGECTTIWLDSLDMYTLQRLGKRVARYIYVALCHRVSTHYIHSQGSTSTMQLQNRPHRRPECVETE